MEKGGDPKGAMAVLHGSRGRLYICPLRARELTCRAHAGRGVRGASGAPLPPCRTCARAPSRRFTLGRVETVRRPRPPPPAPSQQQPSGGPARGSPRPVRQETMVGPGISGTNVGKCSVVTRSTVGCLLSVISSVSIVEFPRNSLVIA